MNEDLQSLVDRIQKEAVQEAQHKADCILAEAEQKAASIVETAHQEAQNLVERARRESQHFTERSRTALEQACRDLLLAVGEGLHEILTFFLKDATESSLKTELIGDILMRLVEHSEFSGNHQSLEILLNPEDREALHGVASHRLRQKLEQGFEIRDDNQITKGFKIRYHAGNVFLDFTSETIATALGHYLRPQLAELFQKTARDKSRQHQTASSS